ncbi:putative A/G-specific adenine glycosylase YfhQ [compost metagenome]
MFRVLSRYYGIHTPINSPAGKKEFYALANELLYQEDPALYNQAIMEFGAMQCKPKSPNCSICPLIQSCYAYQQEQVNTLPVKIGKIKQKHRYINYFVCTENDQVLVKERQAGDIWQHLYDFPSLETTEGHGVNDTAFLAAVQSAFGEAVELTLISTKKHLLTHQIIHVQFFALKNYIFNFNKQKELNWVSLDKLDELPQPKVIHDFIQGYFYKNDME